LTWEENIKIYFMEIGRGGLNWLLLEFNNGYNEVLLGYELGQVVEQ
jgi:hypothetical protein